MKSALELCMVQRFLLPIWFACRSHPTSSCMGQTDFPLPLRPFLCSYEFIYFAKLDFYPNRISHNNSKVQHGRCLWAVHGPEASFATLICMPLSPHKFLHGPDWFPLAPSCLPLVLKKTFILQNLTFIQTALLISHLTFGTCMEVFWWEFGGGV